MPCTRASSLATGTVVPVACSRQWLVDTLRRLGFPQERSAITLTMSDLPHAVRGCPLTSAGVCGGCY
jgi:hypothetical protein